ncbi:MAG TPA: hypothetical protein VFY93_04060 [Planctomycetota bacterium]|nr:hypothetical protein [Planctomycetota bacterium]
MCTRPPRAPKGLDPVQEQAFQLDAATSAVARGLGAFDLALGTTVASLFEGDRLSKLSYARESDYARERLGMSPAALSSCVRLARELRHRPILRMAVAAGAVSPRKALAALPLAVGDYEGAWTEAAMRLSVRELESAAKAAGCATPAERFEAEVLVLPMTPEQQDRLDAALALAKEELGPEAKRWQCTEAICEEYLSSFAEFDPAGAPDGEGGKGGPGGGETADPGGPGGAGAGEGPARAPPMSAHAAKVVARQLAAIEEAREVIRKIEEEFPGEDPLSLDARARRLVAARREWDESLGILARRVFRLGCYETLGYGWAQYCTERLGMREGAVRTRIWLERRMEDLPALRAALSSGRIGYTKAVIVARRATWADVDERIARAQTTTCQQLEREAQAEEDRENRRKGTRRLWSPSDAAQTVRDAIAAAQARARAFFGKEIGAGEALAVIADYFVEEKERHRQAWVREWRSEQRRRVLMRNGGLCVVPGCSRAAVHVHHILFRSRGGPKEEWNELGLCAVHHLHGIHLGYLEVAGRAGERLHWKFATGEAMPTEEWITIGDDDVFRADAGAAPASADRAGADPPCDPRERVTDVKADGAAGRDAEWRAPPATDAESGTPAGATAGRARRGAVPDAEPNTPMATDAVPGVAAPVADGEADGTRSRVTEVNRPASGAAFTDANLAGSEAGAAEGDPDAATAPAAGIGRDEAATTAADADCGGGAGLVGERPAPEYGGSEVDSAGDGMTSDAAARRAPSADPAGDGATAAARPGDPRSHPGQGANRMRRQRLAARPLRPGAFSGGRHRRSRGSLYQERPPCTPRRPDAAPA